ncbi:MAG: carbonic anhydrase [Tannerellaceae bacterium]
MKRKVNTPLDAIKALKEGNQRFVEGKNVFFQNDYKRLLCTSRKQKPFATIIGCSDSRVPVELIFDQGIGDLFIIRTAGNTVGDSLTMGTLDYSIYSLGVKLIIVLGHEGCGGISGAIDCPLTNEKLPGKIPALMHILQKELLMYVGHPEKLDEAIHMNIAKQIHRITKHRYVREQIKKGELAVIGAYYSLKTGSVRFFE